MRLYLDACCLNRPFDDQSQVRIHLESEAVLAIIERTEQGVWTLLGSAALDFELSRTLDPQRRARTQRLLSAATERAPADAAESIRAERWRNVYGLHVLDALHLACAESLRADAFLTTDDRFLRAARRMAAAGELLFSVANPLIWLTEFLTRE